MAMPSRPFFLRDASSVILSEKREEEMPTYTVTAPEGCLDDDQRANIAREITRVHHQTTGAPAYFAQVLFVEIKPGRYFVGGGPLQGKQIFVNGQIRAGRTVESKDALIRQMLAAVAKAAMVPANHVWVYITDLIPRQMAEFGHVLPEPGDEAKWAEGLPVADRAHMESFARK
jgi:phenylpyruvate tautomerase PptA (4-oxalocrotonate tautomerase family)